LGDGGTAKQLAGVIKFWGVYEKKYLFSKKFLKKIKNF
jgi:hypothetical protein